MWDKSYIQEDAEDDKILVGVWNTSNSKEEF